MAKLGKLDIANAQFEVDVEFVKLDAVCKFCFVFLWSIIILFGQVDGRGGWVVVWVVWESEVKVNMASKKGNRIA